MCGEYRTDNGDDAWGFLMNGGAPQCQRCGSIIELGNNGQSDSSADDIDLGDEGNGTDQNGLSQIEGHPVSRIGEQDSG